MKLYESWEFCESINCRAMKRLAGRTEMFCMDCKAYQMHQYLRDNGQILEAGSELAKVVAEAERLRAENEKLNSVVKAANYWMNLSTRPGGQARTTLKCGHVSRLGAPICKACTKKLLSGLEG